MSTTQKLMDLVGPYAGSPECTLEKWFRDAKIYQIFEGTSQPNGSGEIWFSATSGTVAGKP